MRSSIANPRNRFPAQGVRRSALTLVLAIVLMGAIVGFWIGWPSYVAKDFSDSLRHPTQGTILPANLAPEPRDWRDVLIGHQKFRVHINWSLKTQTKPEYYFAVTRGKIHLFPGVCGLSAQLTNPGGASTDIYQRMKEERQDTRLLNDAINNSLMAGGHDYYFEQGGLVTPVSRTAIP